ncbi:MAG: hypothetical protein J6V49_07555 [Bacteroidales bacterium]|nr:hypothetical protein [Bacteroidales bacterium]
MIAVTDAWKEIQQRFLLPETHIEIDCTVTEAGVQESATITGTNEALISNTISALYDTTKSVKYATNELNMWALDGTFTVAPDAPPYADFGYISDIDSTGSVTVSLPEIHASATSGLTINWGGRLDEYPTVFTVTAKNGDEVVYESTVTDNTAQVSAIFAKLQNYDSITITVHAWSLPHRRVRLEKITIGHILTFYKKDIFSYTHEQTGHLNSGELPKNSITFTLDNTDGRWNPNNPTGMEQYLSERQKLKVRYGLDIDGTIEWIPAGTFYLSEWRVPNNGLEANFVARDIFEYLLNETYTGGRSGKLYDLIWDALDSAGIPDDFVYILDPSLNNYSATIPEGEHTCAEIVQMCANAAGCVIFQDRDGVLHIEPLSKVHSNAVIPLTLSYSHPEIELSKPLKNVAVSYGENNYSLSVGSSGETQTVSNPLIGSEAQAEFIAKWVRDTLTTRKTVSGEYRADPRLDVFDIVAVASKYGDLQNVALTDIKYSFNGSFRGNYTGRLLEVTEE